MSARFATLEDLPAVLEWGHKFHEYSPWSDRVPVDPESWFRTASHMIESPNAAIVVSDAGMCGGLMVPLYFNAAHRIAQEVFWYAESGGTELRELFEEWAETNGASAVMFSCLADDKEKPMRRLFRKAGYEPTELQLYKRVN